MVCAVPLQGLAEKHCATGDLHSSQRGNDEIFCGAGFMNQKRPPEDPPTYPRLDLSGCDTHWANYGVPGDFLEASLGNDMMSSNVDKRKRTVQDDYDVDHVPDLGHGSDAFLFTGPTLKPKYKPVTIEVRVLQQNIPNLLSQADRFQASSPHRPQTPDDDHYLSQVLELLQSSDFTNLGLSFLNCANRFPAPESAPENNQDHVQQVHSPFLQAPHGSRDSTRLEVLNQVQSHREFGQSFGFPSASTAQAWYPSHNAPCRNDLDFPVEHSNVLPQEARFQSSPPSCKKSLPDV
ncbi:hypothetical protein PCANC_02736 [Puccinia coronata f. sp. avenae]|uniref:Uncharacterized protein n=1 Tax=Puccinia coronata f. sp. avenae TaxID=200324 RepID=A0A2N5VY99_9BASI|nr:hypothetical protein PCANC_13460 [Puccinia coronata f. sp. avenae]PLW37473.1 hypothetical protein PCASD_10660 [Puccinia coronata f. sp. avenae]PLW54965.1 hypothetical protein PCANC_02736 [Puccinia coronata f. sp. avenae]